MSTRARIAFIVREEGYRFEYSKHWDGYPYAVLGSLPAGTFTIEDLIKRWGLTEESEGFTEYYYEFDFRNMTMKIQYMSDLHMEFAENSRYLKNVEFPVSGDVLVLAGDTFYLNNTTAPLGKFWKWASANYKQVLIVPGNHEYYQGCDIMERGQQWRWMFKENVGYYQNQVARIDDTDFILSTLWSHIPPTDDYIVSRGLNDFYQTKFNGKRLTVEDYNRLHTYCLDFIKKSVAESTAKHIVVVTHHLPTLKAVATRHLGSCLNSAFATELGDFIADSRIDVWIYGHSHTNIDAEIGNTRIVSNQMGYVFENEHLCNGFDAGKFIEI